MSAATAMQARVEATRSLTAELNLHLPPSYFPSRTFREPYRLALAPFLAVDQRPLGVYVNIPLCEERCRFCMYFAGLVDAEGERTEACISGLEHLLSGIADQVRQPVSALYIGGGTPSVLSASQLTRLADALQAVFSFEPGAQRTIEVSPVTATPERMTAVVEGGFNRVSFGVQSFDADVLSKSGRTWTSPDQVRMLVSELLDSGIVEVNIDLMVGLDGTAPGTVAEDARLLLDSQVPTFSVYRYRPARFAELRARGGMDAYVRSCAAEMEEVAVAAEPFGYQMLGPADSEHVRFARSAESAFEDHLSYQTRHRVHLGNSVMGLGAGARSMLRDERFLHCPHRTEDRFDLRDRLVDVEECDSPERLAAAVVNEFARSGRADLESVGDSSGLDVSDRYADELAFLVDLGALVIDGSVAHITDGHREDWVYLDKLFYPPRWLAERARTDRLRIR